MSAAVRVRPKCRSREYIDLGRIFQYGLMAGLFLWLFLVGRALWPALQRGDESRPLLILCERPDRPPS